MNVEKVYINSEGKVERMKIDCTDTISFEFHLAGNRKATVATKSGELIVFMDNIEIIPESKNKIKIA